MSYQVNQSRNTYAKLDNNKNKDFYSLSHYMSNTFNVVMTVCLVLNGLLFIFSHTTDAAYVELKVFSITSRELYLNNVFMKLKNDNNLRDCDGFHYCSNIFQFSLMSSIKDFWDANAYGLAIIIALFSGLWPYIKLLCLGVILFRPIEQQKRSKYLIILDQLGKYSFADMYVGVFIVVSFYVQIITEVNLQVYPIMENHLQYRTYIYTCNVDKMDWNTNRS